MQTLGSMLTILSKGRLSLVSFRPQFHQNTFTKLDVLVSMNSFKLNRTSIPRRLRVCFHIRSCQAVDRKSSSDLNSSITSWTSGSGRVSRESAIAQNFFISLSRVSSKIRFGVNPTPVSRHFLTTDVFIVYSSHLRSFTSLQAS